MQEKSENHILLTFPSLDGRIVGKHIINKDDKKEFRIDLSSIGFGKIHDSDGYAKIVKEFTIPYGFINSFAICDLFKNERKIRTSREILKDILKETKFTVFGSSELEFYLTRNNKPIDQMGYFDIHSDLSKWFHDLTPHINVMHHENGNGQYEVGTDYGNPLEMADKSLFVKQLLEQYFYDQGIKFDDRAKPFRNDFGSGMHIHLSLKNHNEWVFGTDKMTDEMMHFIGGICSFGLHELTLTMNNGSFSRFGEGEAPNFISWGNSNRSAAIRVPNSNVKIIEIRVPDPRCDPFLAFAILIKAGLRGIKEQIKPPNESNFNVYKKNTGLAPLPRSLGEAIKIHQENCDSILKNLLGDFYSPFLEMKKKQLLNT